uniref:Uncharacterized protein n=1 Tax=Romanomermis culicivorax TaxID=13658 RepID=A0A915IP72_ROMCU
MNSKKSTSDKKRYPNFYDRTANSNRPENQYLTSLQLPHFSEDVHLLKGDKVFLKLCGRLQRWDVFHRDRLRQAATDNNYGNDRRPHQLTEILLAAGTMETFGPIFSIYYSKANIILFKMMGVRKKKQKNDGDGEVFVEESSQDVVDELKLVPNAQVETAIDDIDDSNFTHDAPPGQTK